MKLQHLSYQDWLKACPDLAGQSTLEKCPDCRGTGRDECRHCGHETDCENCAGTGKIGDGPDLELLYRRECLREEIAYSRFFGWAIDQKTLDEYHRACKAAPYEEMERAPMRNIVISVTPPAGQVVRGES